MKKEYGIVKATLNLLIKKVKNTDIHMFLHRQIIHVYGKQESHRISAENSWVALDTQESEQNVS